MNGQFMGSLRAVKIPLVVFLSTWATFAFCGGRWLTIYSSDNLTNHSVSVEQSPGDPTTNSGTIEDVHFESLPDRGVVTANIRKTNVYVNAIAYKRFQDVMPGGEPIDLDVFRYRTELRLPVIPTTDPVQTQNAQSAHIMIQMWDGADQVWDAGKTAMEATVFWSLNPWQPADFGKIYMYTTTTGGPLELVDTGMTLPVDTNWHSMELVANFVNGKFVSASADDATFDASGIDIALLKRTNWGPELLYHITTESCSTYPGPGYSNIFWWSTEYRNVKWDKLQFDAEVCTHPTSNGYLDIEWDSELYMSYQVWTSQNLTAWGNASGTIIGNGSTQRFSVPTTGSDQMFYRVQLE